jgi:Rrf2 family protein
VGCISPWRFDSSQPHHLAPPEPPAASRNRTGDNVGMRVSAKADYAVRAAIELAGSADGPVKGDAISKAQRIPLRFLENILGELRHAGVVQSQRGSEGGYWLARSADDITVAEIIRAVEGPLASVRGERPEDLEYRGDAEPLRNVWVALRANIRQILESVTLADIVSGELPDPVLELLVDHPEVWEPH